MSLWSDYKDEFLGEYDPYVAKKGEWIDIKGNTYKIKNLDDSHLLNIARKMIRENWRTYALPEMMREIKARGLNI